MFKVILFSLLPYEITYLVSMQNFTQTQVWVSWGKIFENIVVLNGWSLMKIWRPCLKINQSVTQVSKSLENTYLPKLFFLQNNYP